MKSPPNNTKLKNQKFQNFPQKIHFFNNSQDLQPGLLKALQ